jgi:hypothetical protein
MYDSVRSKKMAEKVVAAIPAVLAVVGQTWTRILNRG